MLAKLDTSLVQNSKLATVWDFHTMSKWKLNVLASFLYSGRKQDSVVQCY